MSETTHHASGRDWPGLAAAAFCLGLARFEPWTLPDLARFLAIAVLVPSIGYALFAFALKVPFD